MVNALTNALISLHSLAGGVLFPQVTFNYKKHGTHLEVLPYFLILDNFEFQIKFVYLRCTLFDFYFCNKHLLIILLNDFTMCYTGSSISSGVRSCAAHGIIFIFFLAHYCVYGLDEHPLCKHSILVWN